MLSRSARTTGSRIASVERDLQLLDRRDQRLGDVSPAKGAEAIAVPSAVIDSAPRGVPRS